MKLLRLYAENMYSFEKIDLDFSLYHNGTTIILGKNLDMDSPNAAGKSNIFKMIYFILWGKDLKGAKIEHIARRHQKDTKGFIGILEFEDEEANHYKIVRSKSYKGSLDIKGSKLHFLINNELFHLDADIIGTQKIIENRLMMTPSIFLNSIMTSQKRTNSFLEENDGNKKDIISELLDLSYIDDALKYVKKDIKDKESLLNDYNILDHKLSLELKNNEELLLDLQNDNKNDFINKKKKEVQELKKKIFSIDEDKKNKLLLKKEQIDKAENNNNKLQLLQNKIFKQKTEKESKLKNLIIQNESNKKNLERNNERLKSILNNSNDSSLKQEILNKKEKIAEIKNIISNYNLDKELIKLQKKESDINYKILSAENKHKELLDKKDKIVKKMDFLLKNHSCSECHRKFTVQENEYLQRTKDELQSKIDVLDKEIQENINNKEVLLAESKELVIFINKLNKQIQEIDIENKKKILNELIVQKGNLENKYNDFLQNAKLRETLLKENEKLEKELFSFDEIKKQLERVIDELTSKEQEIINKKEQFSKIIEQKDKVNLILEKIQNNNLIESKIQLLEENIEVLTYEAKTRDTKLKSINEQIKKTSKDIKKNIKNINELNMELEYLEFWKKGFSRTGMKSFITDQVIMQLNEKANKYLSVLSNGVMAIQIEPQSENNKGLVTNKIITKFFINGEECEFSLNSGGEAQRSILAVDIALSEIVENRSNGYFSIKFLDEPFDGIGSSGQLKALHLFKKLAVEKDGFFLISHDEVLQSFCDNAIYVVKENGVSRLVNKEEFEAKNITL